MSETQVAALSNRSPTRRALLAGVAASIGAAVVRAVTAPGTVRAAGDDGAIIHIGDTYANAQAQTTVANQANNGNVLWVASNSGSGGGSGVAVTGFSVFGKGVVGWSPGGVGLHGSSTSGRALLADSVTGTAVDATSNSGFAVKGASTSAAGVVGSSNNSYGVHGTSVLSQGVLAEGFIGLEAYSPGFRAIDAHSDNGVAVRARTPTTGPAVVASAKRNSITAISSNEGSGVVGVSQSDINDVPPGPARTGVYGQSFSGSSARGVVGLSTGHGVHGEAFAAGAAGLYGVALVGYAIRGNGRLRFDKVSGVATIRAGTLKRVVTPGVPLTSSSFVLLSPNSALGGRDIWYTIDAASDRFTIHISSKRSAGTRIAWLLIG